MYINFQQNRANRSVKPCTQMYLQKNRKLHEFTTANNFFSKINSFRHASSLNVQVYHFSAKSG